MPEIKDRSERVRIATALMAAILSNPFEMARYRAQCDVTNHPENNGKVKHPIEPAVQACEQADRLLEVLARATPNE